MANQILKAKPREVFGRKVKRLRQEGLLPANIYGKKVKSQAIYVSLSDFNKVYKKAGETVIVKISLGTKKKPVLIHNVQVDPVTDIPLHADFFQVNLKEKVTAQVPIEAIGEAPAEKEGKGTAVVQLDEVEVEALPSDLPEKFEVDLTRLSEVDEAIYVKDIKVNKKKVELKSAPEQIIVRIEPLRKEEAEPAPADTAEEQVAEEEEIEKTEKGPKDGEEKEALADQDKTPSEPKKP